MTEPKDHWVKPGQLLRWTDGSWQYACWLTNGEQQTVDFQPGDMALVTERYRCNDCGSGWAIKFILFRQGLHVTTWDATHGTEARTRCWEIVEDGDV